jgi:hypothetical protein
LRSYDVVEGPTRTVRVDEILGVLQTRPRNSDVVVDPTRTAKADDQIWWEMQNARLEALGSKNWRHMEMSAVIQRC